VEVGISLSWKLVEASEVDTKIEESHLFLNKEDWCSMGRVGWMD